MNTTKQRSTRSPHNTPRPPTHALPTAFITLAIAATSAPAMAEAPRANQVATWQMPTAPPPDTAPPRSATHLPATADAAAAGSTPSPTQPHVGYARVGDVPEPQAGWPGYGTHANSPSFRPYGPQPSATSQPYTAVQPDAATEDPEPTAPFFDLAVGTYVPLSLGGQATLELPARLLLQLDLGWMPPAYGSAINGLVEAFGGYNGAMAEIINGSLEDAVVVRVAGGWRPFPSAGFELYGGYTHIALSGSVSPSSVAAIVGGDFANQVATQALTENVDVASRLHNFHVAVGWRFVAFDHLVIRTTLGYTQTLASSSSVETAQVPEAAAIANPIVDAELGKIYKDYVKLPVLGVSGGYRF